MSLSRSLVVERQVPSDLAGIACQPMVLISVQAAVLDFRVNTTSVPERTKKASIIEVFFVGAINNLIGVGSIHRQAFRSQVWLIRRTCSSCKLQHLVG